MDTQNVWMVKMVPVKRTDKTAHIADIAMKTEAALRELHYYYKAGRHLGDSPQKLYFLFSHCAHLLFSLWLIEQNDPTGVIARSPGLATLMPKLDFQALRYLDYSRRMLYANAYEEHLRNEPKWFKFWMGLLQVLQVSDAAGIEKLFGQFSACLAECSFFELEGRPSPQDQKALADLVQGPRAGRLLLQSIWVLEDVVAATSSHIAGLDPSEHLLEQMQLLICLLGQVRRTIIWETAVKGPYAFSAGGDWEVPSTLTRMFRGSARGLLTITLKEEGGEVTCAFTRNSDGRANERTWVRNLSALPYAYEEALSRTWPQATEEQPADAEASGQAQAHWVVHAVEAGHLETIAKHVDIVLEGLGRCPACHALIEDVARVVRNGRSQWTTAQLPRSYLRTLDQLADKLRFACREANAVGGQSPAESVIVRLWPPAAAGGQDSNSMSQYRMRDRWLMSRHT
jgi:hypothetical protein